MQRGAFSSWVGDNNQVDTSFFSTLILAPTLICHTKEKTMSVTTTAIFFPSFTLSKLYDKISLSAAPHQSPCHTTALDLLKFQTEGQRGEKFSRRYPRTKIIFGIRLQLEGEAEAVHSSAAWLLHIERCRH